jgi:hypothetical protein
MSKSYLAAKEGMSALVTILPFKKHGQISVKGRISLFEFPLTKEQK